MCEKMKKEKYNTVQEAVSLARKLYSLREENIIKNRADATAYKPLHHSFSKLNPVLADFMKSFSYNDFALLCYSTVIDTFKLNVSHDEIFQYKKSVSAIISEKDRQIARLQAELEKRK
jgi:hypothetical protein